jgi:hypothetical protein
MKMADTNTDQQGATYARWRFDLYNKPQWTYGNWGGAGWSGGQFNVKEATLNRAIKALDSLDQVFKDHDIAYEDAMFKWQASSKSVGATFLFWKEIIAADNAMLSSIDAIKADGSIGSVDSNAWAAATQATLAFKYIVVNEHELAQARNTNPVKAFEVLPSSDGFLLGVAGSPGEPPPINTPIDSNTRNSSSYIEDGGANDHSVLIKAGGTVWDAFALQKNQPGGFKDWSEFKAAIAASNPEIADLNKIPADSTLMMPEKMSDGSVTYNYANGTVINSNPTTGEYRMSVPDGNGGWLFYSREATDAGYTVRESAYNANGDVTRSFVGHQETKDSEVKPIRTDVEKRAPDTTGEETGSVQEHKSYHYAEDGDGNVTMMVITTKPDGTGTIECYDTDLNLVKTLSLSVNSQTGKGTVTDNIDGKKVVFEAEFDKAALGFESSDPMDTWLRGGGSDSSGLGDVRDGIKYTGVKSVNDQAVNEVTAKDLAAWLTDADMGLGDSVALIVSDGNANTPDQIEAAAGLVGVVNGADPSNSSGISNYNPVEQAGAGFEIKSFFKAFESEAYNKPSAAVQAMQSATMVFNALNSHDSKTQVLAGFNLASSYLGGSLGKEITQDLSYYNGLQSVARLHDAFAKGDSKQIALAFFDILNHSISVGDIRAANGSNDIYYKTAALKYYNYI